MQKKSKSIKESVLKDGVEFLTLEECANYLRVSYFTFFLWVKNGKGPPVVKLSKQCIRVPKNDFLSWCKSKEIAQCTA